MFVAHRIVTGFFGGVIMGVQADRTGNRCVPLHTGRQSQSEGHEDGDIDSHTKVLHDDRISLGHPRLIGKLIMGVHGILRA